MNRTRTATERVMQRAMGTVAVVALVAGTALIAPQENGGFDFKGQSALAAPGGNGNGNGNGADNGNGGNSGNAGNRGSDNASSSGNGQASQGSALGRSVGDGETAHARELGRLNAAHASETARANAAPNSAVGQIASYERNVLEGDLDRAASSLVDAANKDIIEPVVHAVNQLLGIDDTPVGHADDTASDDADVSEFDGPTVHDTEAEIAARANGTFDPPEDGETGAPESARDS